MFGMAKPKTAKKAAPARRQAPTKMPDGDAAVHRGVAGLEKAVAKRVDALIEREVPDVRRAIKWNMPFYGIEGQTRAGVGALVRSEPAAVLHSSARQAEAARSLL